MLMTSRFIRTGLTLLSVITFLTACGGGGGDSDSSEPVPSTLSFPFATANANFINNGYTHNFSLTGWQIVDGVRYNVTGSGTIELASATAAFFEGQAALLNIQTISGTITVNGIDVPLPTTIAQHYSTSNYAPLGTVVAGEEYCVMQGTPIIPVTVKVGDTAELGTFICYTDASKTTLLGTAVISYAIEADTADTAIINLIEKDYDVLNALTLTDQQRWRIDEFGSVSFVSETVKDSTFSYTFI